MFYDLADYIERIVSTSGNIGLITYEDKNLRQSLLNRFESMIENDEQYEFIKIDASIHSIEGLHEKIVLESESAKRDKVIIAIINADLLLPNGIGGTILNGCRERLTLFKATIIVISESLLRYFQIAAPDLMGLVGSFFASAEQMTEPVLDIEDDIL
ncbi:hypothetical protein B6I21_02725 [candidate division KSB1 bacterium 4572_119]|nr:MAG: hypothetical protein B6I21_02725 [candidate division KSB1 bacterium 4572_119]